MRVPADVAVIGFDNSLTALQRDMPSFEFDSTAAVRLMLDLIRRGISGPGIRVFEQQGFVVPRATTGRRQGASGV